MTLAACSGQAIDNVLISSPPRSDLAHARTPERMRPFLFDQSIPHGRPGTRACTTGAASPRRAQKNRAAGDEETMKEQRVGRCVRCMMQIYIPVGKTRVLSLAFHSLSPVFVCFSVR